MRKRAMLWMRRFLVGFGEGVFEVVRMYAIRDLDAHFARETYELTCARIRHHSDR